MKDIPAFPVWSRDINGNMIAVKECMTLRDYFAGQALVALFIYPTSINEIAIKEQNFPYSIISNLSYKIADAMLLERAKQPTN